MCQVRLWPRYMWKCKGRTAVCWGTENVGWWKKESRYSYFPLLQHIGLLAVPGSCQAHSLIRAFALAAPSFWMLSPYTAISLSSLCLSSYLTPFHWILSWPLFVNYNLSLFPRHICFALPYPMYSLFYITYHFPNYHLINLLSISVVYCLSHVLLGKTNEVKGICLFIDMFHSLV